MRKDPDFSYVNDDGKRVTGAAAFNHHVFTEKGGIANYNDDVGERYIKHYVQQVSQDVNDEIERDAKRSRFKVL